MKYNKPKILLVDLDQATFKRLEAIGLNVQQGTFGRPYRHDTPSRDSKNKFTFIFENAILPNFHEQEILILDTKLPELDENPTHHQDFMPPDTGLCTNTPSGIVNPRPVTMLHVSNLVDRILDNAGVLVVFLERDITENLYFYQDYHAPHSYQNRGLNPRPFDTMDNLGFTKHLDAKEMRYSFDLGTEVVLSGADTIISDTLSQHLDSVSFNCTFNPCYTTDLSDSERVKFIPLLFNKYGKTVGGAILIGSGGLILLLPQFERKTDLVSSLLQDVLPITHSKLFPEHEGGKWTRLPEYEHPSIISLNEQSDEIRRDAECRQAELTKQIEAERLRLEYLHGLLTKSGDALVDDVISVLNRIGFMDVIDADKERGATARKEEDIWVRDRSPMLLVEVKGLGGMPTEGDSHQVTKYLKRRMTELKRTDIDGLFIVNHQLGVQPVIRNNLHVFTENQTLDAESDRVALLTTWDLFRLIRGMERWNWPPEVIQRILFTHGRTGLRPSHWRPVGRVAHFYDKISVVSLEVTDPDGLRLGDTVGYALKDRFEQETIDSLQVGGQDVDVVTMGQKGGYKTSLPRNLLPENTPVFKVHPTPS